MLFTSWLRSLQRKHGVSRRLSRPGTLRKGKLAVEFLEERLVPSSNQDFVQQAFLDLLHRPVDGPSLTQLVDALEAGAASRKDVAGFIVTSLEARAVQTQDLFNRYLHRAADPVGLNAFTNFLVTGGSQEQAAAVILGSAEYFGNRGGNSNSGFLDALYEDTLGRSIDPVGRQFFNVALVVGYSREAVAGFVLTSPEYQANLVQSYFQTYLHRPAEDSAVTVFTAALSVGVRDEAVIATIVASQEYFDRANPDQPAPTVTLTSAVSGPTHASPISVTVAFSASVTGFTPDDITVNNGSISHFAGTGAAYTFDLTALSQGAVTVDIAAGVAQDAAGIANTAAAPLSLSFDSIAPQAPTISSAANQTLTGTAEAGSTVAVSLDGRLLGTTTANDSSAWSFDYRGTPLADGSHTFTAAATDAAGNTSATSTGLGLVVDTTAPLAPSIVIFSTGTLSGSAEAGSRVTVFEGAATLATTTAGTTGAWSLSVFLNEGSHSLTATATDAFGNTSPASSPFVANVDTIAPQAPTIAAFSNGVLSGTAEAGSTIKVFEGVNALGSTQADASSNWSLTVNVVQGDHTVTATATDAAENQSGMSAEFTFSTLDTLAPDAPSIAYNQGTGTLSGTAEPGSMVRVFQNGNPVPPVPADLDGGWTYTPIFPTDGTYLFTATATDAAGNESVASPVLSVPIDHTAPAAPTLAFSLGTLSGTAEANSTVRVFNGQALVTTATADSNGVWSATPTLADGTYHFTAKATDASDNTSPASNVVDVTLDHLVPMAPSITFLQGTFSGMAEAGSTVQLFQDGTPLLPTVTAADTGVWSLRPTLAEGTYDFTATATNAANNTSPASSVVRATIDLTAPLAPSITFLQGTFSGTAEAGSTVQLFQDGTPLLPTVTAADTGVWSLRPTLADGMYFFTATATDAAANTSPASSGLLVDVDATPPAAPSIGVQAGGRLSGMTEPNSTVLVFQDGAPIDTVPVDFSGLWSYTPTLTADGTYHFTAKAKDAAGNTGPASSEVLITIDHTAPAAPSIAYSNGTLSGTAEANSFVDVFQNGTRVTGVRTNINGVWSLTLPLADGTYHFTAKATDAAGNTSPASRDILVTIDHTAPTTPSLGYRDGTLSGTAEPGSTVSVFQDGVLLATLTTDGSGVWSVTPTLADRTYHFTATASDTAGNTRPASSELLVTIDTTVPEALSIAYSNGTLSGTAEPGSQVHVFQDSREVKVLPIDNTGLWSYTPIFTGDGVYDFMASATDVAGHTRMANSEVFVTIDTTAPAAPSITYSNGTLSGIAEANSLVQVLQDGTPVTGLLADDNGVWSLTTTFLADGSYHFTATAKDAFGNTSPVSSAVLVTIDHTAPAAPTISYGQGTLFGSAEPGSKVRVFQDGTPLGLTATAASTGAWSLTLTLAEGSYHFTATATDAAGNISPASQVLVVNLDNTPPASPSLTYSPGLLSGTAEAGSTVQVFQDGTPLVPTVTAASNGVWRLPITLADGSYHFTATATDAAHNTSLSSSEVLVTVDSTAPGAPSLDFIDGILSGSAEPNSTVRVFQDGDEVAVLATGNTGFWSLTPTFPADGTYYFTATATDAATNTSPFSSELPVVIDTTAPDAPTIAFNAGTLSGMAEPDSTVQLFQDGAPVTAVPADSTGFWSFTPTLANGTYHFTATAIDAFSNTSPASSEVLVTIEIVLSDAPSIAFSQGTLSGTADPGTTVRVFQDGVPVTAVLADNTGVWSVTPTLANGTYHFTVTATDGTGNTRLASTVVVATIDSTTPTAPSLAYSQGTLSGTANPGSTVKVFQDGAPIATLPIDDSGTWSLTPPLADGTYRFSATVTNGVVSTRPASSEVIVTIDSTVPAAPSITYNDGILSGTAEPNSFVQVFQNGLQVAGFAANSLGTWSYTPSFPTDGSYSFSATATDAGSNASPTSNILVIPIDITAPISAIAFPEDSHAYDMDSWTGSITGTAFDSGSGVEQVAVSIKQETTGLFWDGTAFASVDEVFLPATGTTDWSFSFPADNFPGPDGYTFFSRATDVAGLKEPPGLLNSILFGLG